jgi:hypothetical protein
MELAMYTSWNETHDLPASVSKVLGLHKCIIPNPYFYLLEGVIVFFETGSQYIDYAGLELIFLMPQPPGCWDYRHVLPCPVIPFLYMEKSISFSTYVL